MSNNNYDISYSSTTDDNVYYSSTSDENDSTSSDDSYEEAKRRVGHMFVLATACLLMDSVDRMPCRNSALTEVEEHESVKGYKKC